MDAFKIDNPLGHYQVTKAALTSFYAGTRFGRITAQRRLPIYGIDLLLVEGSTLADLLLDGVRDVDFYQFAPPTPHAQSLPGQERAAAVDAYLAMQKARLRLTGALLAAGDLRLAAYELGLCLHSLHDLVTHEGITNAQHLALDAAGQSRDADPAAAEAALGLTLRLLEHLPSILGYGLAHRFHAAMALGERAERLSAREKRAWFGARPDLHWAAPVYALGKPSPDALENLGETLWAVDEIAEALINPTEAREVDGEGDVRPLVERSLVRGHTKSRQERLFYLPGLAAGLLLPVDPA